MLNKKILLIFVFILLTDCGIQEVQEVQTSEGTLLYTNCGTCSKEAKIYADNIFLTFIPANNKLTINVNLGVTLKATWVTHYDTVLNHISKDSLSSLWDAIPVYETDYFIVPSIKTSEWFWYF